MADSLKVPRIPGAAVIPKQQNPYVSARFGRFTKGLGLRRTPRIKGDATNDGGKNVNFETLHHKHGAHRTLLVPRAPHDAGVCYIDVWHDVGGSSGQHIGGAMLQVNDFQSDDFREETLALYEDGTEEDGAMATGSVTFRMRWHGEKLALQFVSMSDLRDVSQLVVADADSFNDNDITVRALSLFGVYLVVGTVCYDLYFRECTSESALSEVAQAGDGVGASRLSNSTVNFTSNNGEDARSVCRLTFFGLLEALLFQFTTFTTVGFGTHKPFTDDASMLLTALYILVGMAIMGILAGSIGETLVRQVELYTQRLAMMAEDTVEIGFSAGAAGVNLGVQSTAKAAKVVTSVVPTGGQSDITDHGGMTADDIAEMEKEEEEEEQEEQEELKRTEFSPYTQLAAASIGMIVIVSIGTISYMGLDDRPFVHALYFSVVTVTTVGFGDLSPENPGAQIFSLFYIPLGVVMFASAINTVSSIPLRHRRIKLESYVLNQFEEHFSRYDLSVLKRSVDLGRNDPMTKNDFTLAMLLRLGKIKPSDMESIEEVFFKLDADHSGVLDRADVDDLILVAERRQSERDLATFEMEAEKRKRSEAAADVDAVDNPLGAASQGQEGSVA